MRRSKLYETVNHINPKYKKSCQVTALFQRVDKKRHAGKASKNEGVFCEIVFVGVQWYGRERFRKKQEILEIPMPLALPFLSSCAKKWALNVFMKILLR